MDFYSFEPYYKNSPPPFQESTVHIRAKFSEIAEKEYTVSLINRPWYSFSYLCLQSDYAFNRDLFDVALSLNDGHTRQ